MSRAERRCAVALAERLLAGVGERLSDPTRIEQSARVIHIKRPLSPLEVRMLPPGWAELEAIDRAGPVGLLDALAKGWRP